MEQIENKVLGIEKMMGAVSLILENFHALPFALRGGYKFRGHNKPKVICRNGHKNKLPLVTHRAS